MFNHSSLATQVKPSKSVLKKRRDPYTIPQSTVGGVNSAKELAKSLYEEKAYTCRNIEPLELPAFRFFWFILIMEKKVGEGEISQLGSILIPKPA